MIHQMSLMAKYCTHFKDGKTEGQKYELLVSQETIWQALQV